MHRDGQPPKRKSLPVPARGFPLSPRERQALPYFEEHVVPMRKRSVEEQTGAYQPHTTSCRALTLKREAHTCFYGRSPGGLTPTSDALLAPA